MRLSEQIPEWLVRAENPFRLDGRVAIVSGCGASGGIGFATASLLISMGSRVVITSTSERIYDRARELGDAAFPLMGDLTNEETSERLVAAATSNFGGLDVVVHNAGMTSVTSPASRVRDVASVDLATWRSGLARNLDTAYLLSRHTLPLLRERRWGRMVFVASVTGPVMAMRHEPVYAAAKAAMVGLARSIAVDAGRDGVTANAVAPGWIATSSQTVHEADEGRRTPLGRSAHPREVAAAIVWLASPGSSYLTGQCVVVDGGNSIHEERGDDVR